MYRARVLIISNRKEQLIKYKKLIENLNQEAIYTKDLSCALGILQKQEIEFIIISDTIKENLADFIKKIRILTYNSRPIIIAISKSNDLEDKITTLQNGADDFLGEEISKTEFQTRFSAHLRRYFESSINPVTGILDRKITTKALTKSLEEKEKAYILIKVQGIDKYRIHYGEIAYEKVLQTLGAMINSMLSNNDFIGHIKDDEFILITNPLQAEKISAFLVFAFDNILNKFYSTDEFQDNISIQSGDNIQEEKDYLMRLYIASSEKSQNENNYRNIINNLNNLIKLCNSSSNSTYVIDRIRLQGETIENKKNKVLIFEQDSALSYLLKNICEMNDIEATIALDLKDFNKLYAAFRPNLVVLDWGNKEKSNSLELASKISKDNIKIIFTSSFLNKKEILKAGADLYLPKPYEINDMLNWIKKFLN